MVITAFSKEPVSHYLVGIEFVKDRVGVLSECKVQWAKGEEGLGTYLAEASGENDDFVDFTHPFQKVVDTWAFYDVNVVPTVFDFDGDNIVGLLYRLEKQT